MKKLILSFLGIAAIAATTLTSCKKDSTEAAKPAPTVSFNPSATTVEVAAAATYTLTVTYHADQKLSKISTTKAVGAAGATYLADVTTFSSETEHIINYVLTAEASGSAVYTFTVTDKDGQVASQSFTLKVPAVADLNTYTARLFGGQSNTTYGSYFVSTTGEVIKQAAADAASGSVDVVYYFGSSNEATFVAPSDATVNGGSGNLTLCSNFTTKNATQLITAASGDFDSATGTTLSALSFSSSTTLKNHMVVGSVFAFKTVGNKVGIAKVTAVTTGAAGTITIDVKVQK